MKLQLIALAAAALFVGQAEAAQPAPLTAYTYYVSGSSALTPIIKAIFQTNSTTPSVAPASFQDKASGAGQFIYQATIKKTSVLGTKLGLTADTLVTVFKRDAGGSIYGVNPLVSGAGSTPVAIDYLSETSTFDANNVASTIVTKQHVPELGAADVEPKILNQPFNLARNADGTPVFPALSTFTGLTTKPALLASFGVAVNNNLYTALQTAQGLSGSAIPNITIDQVRSLVNANALTSANNASWGYLLNNSDLSQINIGRRTPGSGTQASANILFSNTCSSSPDVPLVHANSDATGPGSSGILYVNEGAGTGNVIAFLNHADQAGAGTYALGYVGYENKPGASDTWKFVKLDGATADIANTQNGSYQWAFENTYNYNTAYYNANANHVKGFIDGMIAESQDPATISLLSPALQSAVIPVSISTTTRNGDSCSLLKLVK